MDFIYAPPQVLKFFQEKLGFTPGSKTYTVRVPKAIRNAKNPDIWAAFVRGYVDCDGNFYCMKRNEINYAPIRRILHMYPKISVGSVSKQMILDISELLKKLGIKHSVHEHEPKNPRFSTNWTISVRGNKRVNRWMKIIGFNNPVQRSRYKIWKIHGFVPPGTNLEERRQILNGRRCPLEYYLAL